MKNYTVTATGTWNLSIKAKSIEEAEQLAYQECLDEGLDVGFMNLEFEAFDEEDE
jgi:hypothetical protein